MVVITTAVPPRKERPMSIKQKMSGHQRRSGKTGGGGGNLLPLQGIEPHSFNCLTTSLFPIPTELSEIHLLFQIDHKLA